MVRKRPIIDFLDDKVNFFREQLFREVSNLFEWEGLPEGIPADYLEKQLVRGGRVMFFTEPETFGYMALPCSVMGHNVYQQPLEAMATTPNQEGHKVNRKRKIAYCYTPSLNLDPASMCVVINNMPGGESLIDIVEFWARRMALLIQAFDTNTIWQNAPAIFRVGDKNLKLTIEKMYDEIITGKPFVIVDQAMLGDQGLAQVTDIRQDFYLDKLLDTFNEVRAKFRETVGIQTPGADKAERLLTDEVNSNEQARETALAVMLAQRERACEEIKKLFGLDITVTVRKEEENGQGDNRIEETPGDDEF